MTTLTRVCLEQDFNSATQTCANEVWMVQDPSSILPELTLADASAIATSIAVLWAIAWGFRQARKALETIN